MLAFAAIALLSTPLAPISLGEAPSSGPFSAIDLDGDGQPELVVLGQNTLFVLDPHSQEKKLELPLPAAQRQAPASAVDLLAKSGHASGVTVCALDDSAGPEVVFGTSDGRLFAASPRTRKWLTGFPAKLDAAVAAPVACADLDNDGKNELVVATQAGSVYVFSGSKLVPGFPLRLGAPLGGGLAVGSLRGGEPPSLFVATDDGKLHGRSATGATLAGFPVDIGFRAGGPPVIGDLDDDGEAEIVVASQDYKIYAFRSDGGVQPGFPYAAGYRFYGAPALGDLDGDDILDVVAAAADGKLYALNGSGKPILGFPANLGPKFTHGPVIVDLSGDGTNELVVADPRGRIFVVNSDGTLAKGPSLVTDVAIKTPLSLAQIGKAILVYCGGAGQIFRFALGDGVLVWPTLAANPARTGRFGPSPGRYKALAISPEHPRTDDILKLSYRFFDLDGDPEQATEIHWYKNGVLVAELDGKRDVPKHLTKKHDKFHFTVQGAGTRLATSAAVEIENSPPLAPKVAVTPNEPRTEDTLTAKITAAAKDADGDPVRYEFAWGRDGGLQAQLGAGATVAPEHTRKNERWIVVATPHDDEVAGEQASAETWIRNTAPGRCQARLDPTDIRVTSEVTVVVDQPASDADGDKPIYHYEWRIDGELQNLPPTSAWLPRGYVGKNRDIEVKVTPVDDEGLTGGPIALRARSRNSPPLPPVLALAPAKAKKKEGIALELRVPAIDPDGDPVTYATSWRVDDRPSEQNVWAIPERLVARGQKWRAQVIASDPEGTGGSGSAEGMIVNTPPRGLWAVLDDHRPRTSAGIGVRIVTAGSDDDGDAVRLKYRWLKNGISQPFPESQAKLNPFVAKKGDRWRVVVTSFDGQEDGDDVELEVVVDNTPPTAPAVALPAHGMVGDRLAASITATSKDDDGDRLSYRYRWFVDGQRIEAPETTGELDPLRVRKGQVVHVEVAAFDGEAEGPRAFAATPIINTPPTAPTVDLRPIKATVERPLQCAVTFDARDADRDALVLEYEWTLDGRPYALSKNHASIEPTVLRRGQEWSCRARASDGSARGPWSAAITRRIDNTPPSPPQLALLPSAPTVADDLVCQVVAIASDADADRLRHRYFWFKNGVMDAQAKSLRLDKTRLRKHDRWRCAMEVTDSEGVSAVSRVEAQIENSVPSQAVIELVPARARAGEGLECRIVNTATDLDGDTLSYRFAWLKDGQPQKFAATTTKLPGRLVKDRELWECEVVASDGQAQGPAVRSASVHVGKVPPK